MESMIASFVDGRVRLRHNVLKNADIMLQIDAFVRTLSGVLSVEGNVRTGSLLIHYDPEILDEETLNTLLEQAAILLGQEDSPAANEAPATSGFCLSCAAEKFLELPNRKNFKRTLGVLVPLMVALALTNKRYHAMAGGLFVALSLGHMWRKRKALL